MTTFAVDGDGVTLHGEDSGVGPAVLLLHGLSATRRYVLHGSTALEREGYRVIAYDSRGHGDSSPAPSPGDYRYDQLAADALRVLDARGVDRAALVGMSMGSAVAAAVALDHPDRVTALLRECHLSDGRDRTGVVARQCGSRPIHKQILTAPKDGLWDVTGLKASCKLCQLGGGVQQVIRE